MGDEMSNVLQYTGPSGQEEKHSLQRSFEIMKTCAKNGYICYHIIITNFTVCNVGQNIYYCQKTLLIFKQHLLNIRNVSKKKKIMIKGI
jgi:hypothetical protein